MTQENPALEQSTIAERGESFVLIYEVPKGSDHYPLEIAINFYAYVAAIA